jgi:hypothetical protein
MCSIEPHSAGPDGVSEVHDAPAPIVTGAPIEVSPGVLVDSRPPGPAGAQRRQRGFFAGHLCTRRCVFV